MSAPVMGLDPGVSGGIALIISLEQKPLLWSFAGATLHDLWIIVGGCKSYEGVTAYIEDLHAMSTSYKANWGLGRSVGQLEALLTAHQIRCEPVKPKVWQAEFGLLRKKKSETDGQKKARHRGVAQQLWPDVAGCITNSTVDALLIAEWGRRR